MSRYALLLPLFAVACTPKSAPLHAVGDAAAPCQVATLKAFTGRPGSAVLAADALAQSGARTIRWLKPGDLVTMEYREDRLNIRLDGRGIVKEFTCG